jgi:hypothetical protein
MKKIFILLTLLSSLSAYAQSHLFGYERNGFFTYKTNSQFPPLGVDLWLDRKWDDSQKDLLRRATRIFIERIDDDNVRSCAFRHTNKDIQWSEDGFRNGVWSWLMIPCFDCNPERQLLIQKLDLGDGTAGRAKVSGHISTTNAVYMKVELNEKLVNSPNYDWGFDDQYWAGVIAHEVLHNWRFDHPTGYEGSFINEFGDCLWRPNR